MRHCERREAFFARGHRLFRDLGITGLVTVITGVLFVVSLGLAVLAHSQRLAPGRMIDLGLLFEIFVAFLSGVLIRLAPGPLQMPQGWGISEICLLIRGGTDPCKSCSLESACKGRRRSMI